MSDTAAELGELLDALGHLHTDDDEEEGGGPGRRGRGQGRRFERLTSSAAGRPVATDLPAAAQLLGVPQARLKRAAQAVQPYVHANGSPRWSLRLLELELGQQPRTGTGSGVGSAWRGQV